MKPQEIEIQVRLVGIDEALALIHQLKGALAALRVDVVDATDQPMISGVTEDPGVLQDDLRELLEVLGIEYGASPLSPHQVFQQVAMPAVRDAVMKLGRTRP